MKKYFIIISSIGVIVITLVLVQVRSVRSGSQIPSPTPNVLTPVDLASLPVMPTAIQPEVVDLAPNTPNEDKPAVVVQHLDGSRTMYLVAPDEVDAFIDNLPKEDELKLVIPPPSLMGHEPPVDTPMNSDLLPLMPTAIQPKVTDLAPDIPYQEKPSVVVRHADGSLERYLLAPDALDSFIKNLPKGDTFLGDLPPPSFLLTPPEP